MLKHAIFFLTALCLGWTALNADINTARLLKRKRAPNTIQEGVKLPISHEALQHWKLAYSVVTPEGAIFEWIPKDEEIEQWSELVQIQSFVLSKPQAAENFAKNFLNTLKKDFPAVKANVIQQTKDSVLLEWSLPTTISDQVPQSEIARIISTPKGVYRIAYTKKTPTLDTPLDADTRLQWIKRLAEAQVVSRNPPKKTYQD